MQNGARAYLATQVNTTSQGDLLVMLYDAAIKFLNQAKVEIGNKNYAQKGILISKAIDIVAELANSLNKEKGGELAQNLNSIYFFLSTRLARANLRMSIEMVDEVISILNTLRNAFAQINGGGVKAADENVAKALANVAKEAPARQTPATPPPGGFGLDPRFAAASAASKASPQPAASTPGAPAPDTADSGAPEQTAPGAMAPPPSKAAETHGKAAPLPDAESKAEPQDKADAPTPPAPAVAPGAPARPRPTTARARAAAAYSNSS